ncbi:hypothetical protein [Helicobacter sp. MIT 14-3879]|uniref:hypothetical protein n=1 Tax=Helicobacter sp. MIT 14-3879 TaxID=2040649 RepID=UPI0015F1B71A|nr:hypothetical protein [Helicobacter sp. MIT 14-3879]
MFRENYSIELVLSAIITMGVILMIVRIYLKIINSRNDIRKPDWLSDSEFEEKFGSRKK